MAGECSPAAADTPVHVLWTGGWDSTFRVLDLALRQGTPVQPHYIIDPGRASTPFELDALDRIRDAANARSGEPRIADPRRVLLEDIAIPDDVREMHRSLVTRFRIGGQYAWLVAYAEQGDFECLELCIHVDDRAYAIASAERTDPGQISSEDSTRRRRFLACFAFPVLELSKTDMFRQAEQAGFADLLELSWFCHLPTASGGPCGFCRPCRWTVAEGLRHRVPLAARACAAVDSVAQRVPSMRFRLLVRDALRRLR